MYMIVGEHLQVSNEQVLQHSEQKEQNEASPPRLTRLERIRLQVISSIDMCHCSVLPNLLIC